MSSTSDRHFRETLEAAGTGDGAAAERLIPLIYDDLRAIAGAHLRQERAGHTLQPTALVHEAFLRLAERGAVPARSRVEYLAIGARLIRQILVDHARRRLALKRGGNARRITLSEHDAAADSIVGEEVDVLGLDQALRALRARSQRQASVVELRFFGGLTVEEAATALGVSPRTVKGEWRAARAWLHRELMASMGDDET